MVNESYYQSPEWKAKRERRLEIDAYECRLCGVIYGNHILNCSASMENIS